MKTSDEMVRSLLSRREAYAVEQRRKRKIAARITASVCCVGMVILLGVGLMRSGWRNADVQGSSANTADANKLQAPVDCWEDNLCWNSVEKRADARVAAAFSDVTKKDWLSQYAVNLPDDLHHEKFALGYEINKDTAQPTDVPVRGYASFVLADDSTVTLDTVHEKKYALHQENLLFYFYSVPEKMDLSKINGKDVFLGEDQANGKWYAVFHQKGTTCFAEFTGDDSRTFSAFLHDLLAD